QTQMMGVFDFAKYPKVDAWLARMQKLEYHDEMHEVLRGFLNSIGLLPTSTASTATGP
ncbi:Glutathione transferase, theta class, partial [Globisporangium polare]